MTGTWTMMDDLLLYEQYEKHNARFGLLALNQGMWENTVVNADYFAAATSTSQISIGLRLFVVDQWTIFVLLPSYPVGISGKFDSFRSIECTWLLGKEMIKNYVIPSKGMVVVHAGSAAEDSNFALSGFDNEY